MDAITAFYVDHLNGQLHIRIDTDHGELVTQFDLEGATSIRDQITQVIKQIVEYWRDKI